MLTQAVNASTSQMVDELADIIGVPERGEGDGTGPDTNPDDLEETGGVEEDGTGDGPPTDPEPQGK